MQSFLIAGSDEKGRLKKFEEIAGKKLSTLEKSPDFLLLEIGEGNSIGIEEIRNLKGKLALKPFSEKQKTSLILEAQNLTTEAQNALLKTLEEPNATSLIFLTVPEVLLLLPTVVSRCQIITLPNKINVELKENELEEILSILKEILFSSAGRRIKIIEEEGITKDRGTAVKWLNKLTLVIRKLLLNNFTLEEKVSPEIYPTNKLLKILSLIRKYQKFLEANCNVKLTIEVFLSELPSNKLNDKKEKG